MQPDFQTWIENNARRWASLIRTGLPEFTLISDNELCYWVPTKTLFIPEKMVAQYDRQPEHVADLLFWIAHEYSHYVVDIKALPVYGYAEEDYCNRLGAYLSGVAPADGYRALYDLLPEVWAADVGMSLEEAIANIPDELMPGKVFPFPIPPKADDESYGLLETEPKGDYERVYRKFPRGHWGFRSNNIEPEVLSQYPLGDVPDNTEKETSVPESPMPILKGTEVVRTSPEHDEAVKHLGYEPITIPEGQSIPHGMLTDVQLLADSQRRLAGVSPVPDDSLQPDQIAHLHLARAIVVRTAPGIREVQAASIPPASDRVRTAGMYGRTTKDIYIATEQLSTGRKTVDTTIHEAAHHTSGAEDGQEAHKDEMARLAGQVVSGVAEGTYDKLIKSPGFTWY